MPLTSQDLNPEVQPSLDELLINPKQSWLRRVFRKRKWMTLRNAIKVLLPFIFLFLAVAAVFIVLLSPPPTPPRVATEAPALLVQVIPVQRESVRFTVTSQGTVTPRIRTTIVSEVTGHIVEVASSYESGGFFSEGEVIARVDPRNYETALKRAQADLAKARTKVQTETALASQAKSDWEKLQALSPSQDLPSDLTLRKPQLAEVLAEFDLMSAALEKAEEDLERTYVRAPYDSMVIEKHADLGQFVNTGTQIATTISVQIAEVRLPLALRDFQYLDLEQVSHGVRVPVTLTADVGHEELASWEGHIVRSEGIINESARVIYVVAQVENPYTTDNPDDHPLLIGTFVNAEIRGREAGGLFVLPRHAVYEGDKAWVVDEDNLIYPRDLTIVRSDSKYSYISEGLADNDKICITPIEQPLPGLRVRYSE